MIITTLLLALDLVTRTVGAEPTVAELESTYDATEAQRLQQVRDELRSELALLLERETAAVQPASTIEALMERLKRAQAERYEIMAAQQVQDRAATDLRRRVRDVEARSQRLSEALAELETQREQAAVRQPITRLVGDSPNQRTWWVRLTEGPTLVGEVTTTVSDTPAEASSGVVELGRSTDEILAWVGDRQAGSDALVLVVEPGGVRRFHALRAELEARGFDVGWNLALSDESGGRP